jgi:predicted nucleotide-binding protein (sugar kinase/HSP70/actin superfamily)
VNFLQDALEKHQKYRNRITQGYEKKLKHLEREKKIEVVYVKLN